MTKTYIILQPATVSRCGMIYLEPSTLGWKPLAKSWMQDLPAPISENPELMELLEGLFDWLVDPSVDFIRKNTKVRRVLLGH